MPESKKNEKAWNHKTMSLRRRGGLDVLAGYKRGNNLPRDGLDLGPTTNGGCVLVSANKGTKGIPEAVTNRRSTKLGMINGVLAVDIG